ncbi:uncharacterized protein DFL_004446 [Arthrobotrys flagrans]|uniref:NmrA-like domain-containing protein n=1 Tax=Arthrobotrys flagrans TaxID=97331 RepID=A0A437A4V3_ARTFL|nr:hypothetical protein DFL_004446 [Arthrobotrys flagrans]
MVKIAISGGTGNVAQEVFDALVVTGKHEIILLSRKDVPSTPLPPGVTQVKANYEDVEELVKVLQGVHTVLCFITSQSDPGNVSQRNLIDASVKAGVKRYAPSEWATSSLDYLPWYDGKGEIRKYLQDLNKDKQVLEYSLFQPGLFTNYFAAPHQTAKHVFAFPLQIDFANRRAIILEGGEDAPINLVTVEDFANLVALAVEYQGAWPLVGGIKGDEVTVRQLITIGEKIRGGPFAVEKLKAEDLKAGIVKSTWIPKINHPSLPAEQIESLSQGFTSGILLALSDGAYRVNDAWNRLLPDYKITQVEEFLTAVWHDKV